MGEELPDGAVLNLVYIARRNEWGGSLSLRPDGDRTKPSEVYADWAPSLAELIDKLQAEYQRWSRSHQPVTASD